MTNITTWMLLNPWIALPILAFVMYTVFVNLLDETDGMFPRYVAAFALPWVFAYYLHISSIIMYGESILKYNPFRALSIMGL